MSAKKVVTKGGGKNLFKVSESGGDFYVSQQEVGLVAQHKLGKHEVLRMHCH